MGNELVNLGHRFQLGHHHGPPYLMFHRRRGFVVRNDSDGLGALAAQPQDAAKLACDYVFIFVLPCRADVILSAMCFGDGRSLQATKWRQAMRNAALKKISKSY